MSVTLEKVDELRLRTNISYQKAKELLEQTDGDVLEAIILIENEDTPADKFTKKTTDFANDVIQILKDLINTGNVNRIVVEQKNGTVIMNIPVTVGAIGAVFLTSFMVVGLIAAIATGCIIKIHKETGEVVNVNDLATKAYEDTKEKANDLYENIKTKVRNTEDVTEDVIDKIIEEDLEEEKKEDLDDVFDSTEEKNED